MIDSIFKKQEKFLYRTPGYQKFQPIRNPYSTVVFKIWGWAWAAEKETKGQTRCVVFFALCVRVLDVLFMVCVVGFLRTYVLIFVVFLVHCAYIVWRVLCACVLGSWTMTGL